MLIQFIWVLDKEALEMNSTSLEEKSYSNVYNETPILDEAYLDRCEDGHPNMPVIWVVTDLPQCPHVGFYVDIGFDRSIRVERVNVDASSSKSSVKYQCWCIYTPL